jgi:hypothetical protein
VLLSLSFSSIGTSISLSLSVSRTGITKVMQKYRCPRNMYRKLKGEYYGPKKWK